MYRLLDLFPWFYHRTEQGSRGQQTSLRPRCGIARWTIYVRNLSPVNAKLTSLFSICTEIASSVNQLWALCPGHRTQDVRCRLKLNADKTKLLFASSSYSCATLSDSYPGLTIGANIVAACSHVRLLGVDISCDLSLDHHVSRISAGSYYRLHQLRRLRRSLDSNSLATLVYAVANSQIDYCNTVLAASCWCTKNSNEQVTACVERCCACRHLHLEIWLRPGSDTAWKTSLARRPRPGVFQAGSDSSPVSERPRTAVPVGLLRSGRRCRHSAAPAFRQPSTACSTSLPAQHLRP